MESIFVLGIVSSVFIDSKQPSHLEDDAFTEGVKAHMRLCLCVPLVRLLDDASVHSSSETLSSRAQREEADTEPRRRHQKTHFAVMISRGTQCKGAATYPLAWPATYHRQLRPNRRKRSTTPKKYTKVKMSVG